MDRFLRLLEKSQPEAIIDEEKLKSFTSKVSIWDHSSITEQAYKSSGVEEKTSLLNRYYRELYRKYYWSGNFYLFVILCDCLLSAIFRLVLVLILLLFLSF